MARVSCIIPAYNEESRIGNVLSVVVEHPLIAEVIVVDDGSRDNTKTVASSFSKVRVMAQKNQGKSAAICAGIQASVGDFIFLLDADLIGLSSENITALVQPVLSEKADISISLRKNSPKLWRLIGLDYISGERVMPRAFILQHVGAILALPKFGLEVFMNRKIVKNKFRIKIVVWPNVESPLKHKKYGIWSGIRGDIGMMLDIFRTVSPFGLFFQIIHMLRLRVQ